MRRLPVLLVMTLLASLVTTLTATVGLRPADAAASPKGTTVTLRLAPSKVTVYEGGMVEPTGLVAQVGPAVARRTVTFQQSAGATWRTLGKVSTDSTGRAFQPLTVTKVGSSTYRVAVSGTRYYRSARSRAAKLVANSNDSAVDGHGCQPATGPADKGATGEVYCLLQRLDSWRSGGLMGVGQQLNVSNDKYLAPLKGVRPNVIGFDLQELADGETYGFSTPPLTKLLDLARNGAVLTATWHAKDPFQGSTPNLRILLAPQDGNEAEDAIYHRFWDDWDTKLALLKRIQTGDGDGTRQAAVVLRPFHEVNGKFFWWGQPTTRLYKQLWNTLQDRAWSAGVHNVVWAYSGNRHTSSTKDPALYLPDKERVDVGGLDTYDPDHKAADAKDVLNLEGYASIAKAADQQGLERIALTEVGPHGSADGHWNPAVISSTARKAKIRPLWAMLWFDDGNARDGYSGKKQIISLTGGVSWLKSCFNSLCYLR